ncbi:MAG: DUF4349 domain-containing protein [Sphaerobacter sp.]|nr:DUF4349 domain-containing protein [Sphaerobacter sp.]
MRASGRSTLVVFLALLMMGLLVACGGGATREESAAPGAGGGASSGAPAAAAGESDASATSGSALPAEWDRRILRTAEVALTVRDVEQAIAAVRDTATSMGGQILSSSTSYRDELQFAHLIVEVPADRFDAAMSALRGHPLVARVDRETTSSQDVTEEYVDLQARLRNAEATEQRFLALQTEATRLEDILVLEREIARVRGEIEQIKGRLTYLERRTGYSRIDLQLQPIAAGQAPGIDFARTVREAWDASLHFVGRVAMVGVTAVVFLWWLWPLAAAGALLVVRRGRRRGATPGATGA